MSFRRITLASSLLLAAMAIAGVQDAVAIKWAPKAGTKLTYKVKAFAKDVSGPMGKTDVTLNFTLQRSIKEVAEGRITVEEVQEDMKVMLGEQEIPDDRKVTATYVYSPTGKILERSSDAGMETEQPRLEAAMAFEFPDKALKPGDTWTITSPGDKDKGTFPSTSTFTYVATEMVDGKPANKITVDYKESETSEPVTCVGTAWLNPEDGEPVKSNYSIKRVELGPLGVVDLEVTSTKA